MLEIMYNLIKSKEQTKRVEVLCFEHKKRFSDLGWINTCNWYCHLKNKLVCANCETEIEINQKYEQYCPKCGIVNN